MMFALDIKKIRNSALVVFLLMFAVVPSITFSAPSTETTNDRTGITYECGDGITAGNCDFQDLLNAVKLAVNKGIQITLSLSVIVIAYAGYHYMISGDNPGERKKANEMLRKTALGIFFILAAWLIVSLILSALRVDSPVRF